MASPCKILIVDDSIVFRSQIRAAIGDMPGMEVAGTASNGKVACEFLAKNQVDVITLDLEMPVMNGLETLAELKRLGIRAQVIVFSSHSVAGANATLSALAAGATDFITKPDLTKNPNQTPAEAIRKEIVPRIEQLMKHRAPQHVPSTVIPLVQAKAVAPTYSSINFNLFSPKMIVIASSTGGPKALEDLISTLPGPLTVPICIAQHMPPIFTASLASRIEKLSKIPTAEVKNGEPLLPGKIYIAPGDYHFHIVGTADAPHAMLTQGAQRNSVRPCADFLFETAAQIFKDRLLGVVLTGMGADGADGAVAVKKNHGAVIIQNKETCVVFGMPGAVFDRNAYDKMGNLKDIAAWLMDRRLAA